MSRPKLALARQPKPVTRALIVQAVRLFRSDLAPRSVRRANARKWLAMNLWLGDRHVLHSKQPKVGWGTQRGIRP